MEENKLFPHASELLKPVNRFFVGRRWLCLYFHTNRNPTAPYSLYWYDEINPVQSGMTALESLRVLQSILTPELAEGYVTLRQSLRDLLAKNDVPSNPAVSDEWIIGAIKQTIEKKFWSTFHFVWGIDRGEGKARPDYDKKAWLYVQEKINSYFSK